MKHEYGSTKAKHLSQASCCTASKPLQSAWSAAEVHCSLPSDTDNGSGRADVSIPSKCFFTMSGQTTLRVPFTNQSLQLRALLLIRTLLHYPKAMSARGTCYVASCKSSLWEHMPDSSPVFVQILRRTVLHQPWRQLAASPSPYHSASTSQSC